MVVSTGDWVLDWACKALVLDIIRDNRNNVEIAVDRMWSENLSIEVFFITESLIDSTWNRAQKKFFFQTTGKTTAICH